LKFRLMDEIQAENWDVALETVREMIEAKVTSYELNVVVEKLATLKLAEKRDIFYEHNKKVAYIYASKI